MVDQGWTTANPENGPPKRQDSRDQLNGLVRDLRKSRERLDNMTPERNPYTADSMRMAWKGPGTPLEALDALLAAAEKSLAEYPPASHKRGVNARRAIVAMCGGLFEKARPGEASTTQGADFESFVDSVMRACGAMPEGDGSNLRLIKEVLAKKRLRARNVRHP
ncbi:MAG: hypothetical protein WD341_19560 [Tistlia sp.]|uniref:hypothetical protein n=1 Tax=Tistlia sp. TaxID=3057121 RepID=UPI0034A50D20